MNHWQTVSSTGIICGIVSQLSFRYRSATDTMPRTKTSTAKNWSVTVRPDIRQLVIQAAVDRGIKHAVLAARILTDWLNANILKQPITRTDPPQGGKIAYRAGQLAAIDGLIYGGIRCDSYLFDPVETLSELRKQLKRDNRLTTDIQKLYDDMGAGYYSHKWTSTYYPWFFIGLYNLPTDFLSSGIVRTDTLPPEGTINLATGEVGADQMKRRGTTPLQFGSVPVVQTAVRAAASQLTYTVIGLVETILIDWLNRNQLADHTEARAAVPTESRQSYTAGQLARLELDQFGEVSLDGYLRDAGASLGSLKPRLRKAKQLTRATETLFREVRLTDFVIPPARRFWFFAGFCGLSFDFLAAKHLRGEIPGN